MFSLLGPEGDRGGVSQFLVCLYKHLLFESLCLDWTLAVGVQALFLPRESQTFNPTKTLQDLDYWKLLLVFEATRCEPSRVQMLLNTIHILQGHIKTTSHITIGLCLGFLWNPKAPASKKKSIFKWHFEPYETIYARWNRVGMEHSCTCRHDNSAVNLHAYFASLRACVPSEQLVIV